MGVYLPKPETTKHSLDGGNFGHTSTRFGVSAMQGWRLHMEDAHLSVTQFKNDQFKSMGIYGVFDGHGGPAVSSWASSNFESVFERQLAEASEAFEKQCLVSKIPELDPHISAVCEALKRTFLRLDVEMGFLENREIIRAIHNEAQMKREQEDIAAFKDEEQSRLVNLIISRVHGHNAAPQLVKVDNQPFSLDAADVDSDDIVDDEAHESPRQESNEVTSLPTNSEDTTSLSSTRRTKLNVILKTNNHDQHSESLDEGEHKSGKNSSENAYTTAPIVHDDDTKSVESLVSNHNLNLDSSDKSHGTTVLDCIPLTESKDNTNNAPNSKPFSYEPVVVEADGRDTSEPVEDSNMYPASFEDQPESCGSTAIVVVVLPASETHSSHLVIANAGDSRAVLSRNGCAIPLSKDHKPSLKGESRRIMKAGGKVLGGRVDGNLNLSRALGDLYYKNNSQIPPEDQKIVSDPDIRVVGLCPEDEFVILACDGIWDCLSNQDVVNFFHMHLKEASMNGELPQLSKICEKMCDYCLSTNPLNSEGGIGCDNMTIMIVLLQEYSMNEGGSELRCPSELTIDTVSKVYGHYCEDDYELHVPEYCD